MPHPIVAYAGGLLVAALAATPVAAAAAPLASTPVTISVASASSGHVDGGFAGFSYEKDEVGAGMFDAHDTNLVRLFRRLGPSVLRIGGNTADRVNWNPTGAGGSITEIAPADVTRLAGFLRATGWKAIYGIDLKINTPANAASEARFAARALRGSLLAFEIGNEPNFYKTESAYEASYNSYVSAIRAMVPNAVFDGPGAADTTTSFATAFAADEKDNHLAILSHHLYIGSNTTATIAGMLASNASGRLPNVESSIGSAQQANGIRRWRMTEANSYFHGGAAGVSDVEAASLWSLEFMDGIASHGGSGVNFHGGTSVYSPITFSGLTPTGVQGVYYGELLWKLAGDGSLHAATVSGDPSTTAWGIGNNVIVDNKGSNTVTATIPLRSRARHAREYVLTAPSLTSKAITIAGSAVSVSGRFAPSPVRVRPSDGRVVVTVPPDSAALIVDG